MLFLIPPSESKRVGGGSLSIDQVALTFGGLNPAREKVLKALTKLCKKPREAARVLKIGPKMLDEIQHNLEVLTAPTMPALDRYTGTLYDAIDAPSLSQEARLRAKQTLLIQTALFGLIPATDLIPNYRLSANTALPGVNLKAVWRDAHQPIFRRLHQGLIIDLRSKAYTELAPIPSEIPSVYLEVVQEAESGALRALNHFNKLAKGRLVRAVLEAKSQVQTWDQLTEVAQSIGYRLREPDKNRIAYLVIGMTPESP